MIRFVLAVYAISAVLCLVFYFQLYYTKGNLKRDFKTLMMLMFLPGINLACALLVGITIIASAVDPLDTKNKRQE